MKKYLLMALPLFLYGESLQTLLEHASNHNELVVSKSISKDAKQSELKSSESNYFPTVDIGGFYQRLDDANPMSPGTTYSGYAKVGVDIYNGGATKYAIEQKEDELRASGFVYEATKKNVALSIVQDFYNYKTLEANLLALQDESKAVKAQLNRMQSFYEAKLATSDDVDRLQSAYDKNIYDIESMKFQLLSLKKSLELKVGKKIDTLDNSSFTKLEDKNTQELDSIKALRAQKSSIINKSETIDSYYYPQIRVEDTYSFYGYMDEPVTPGFTIELPDQQNKIMATINMRIFDFGAIGEAKEAVQLNAKALSQEIIYQNKEQKMNQELALSRIETAKLNIKSATSALKAADSALVSITEKYNNGIVDNVVYLDALSMQTESKSRYEASLNNLEISYALYYYYNGKKLEEFLNE
jgi:outer membrane protein